MITSMSDHSRLIVITNRQICSGDYLTQLERVLSLQPHALILREKDLLEAEYIALAWGRLWHSAKQRRLPVFAHGGIILVNGHCLQKAGAKWGG